METPLMGRSIILSCLPWAAILVASFLVLFAIARLSRARFRPRRILRLHADQRGSSQSLAFVLTLPLFIMVLMFIVQVSQVMIGQMVVEYSAFAAARTAAVWIPADLSRLSIEEGANRVVGYSLDRVEEDADTGATGSVYRLYDMGLKYNKIQQAAWLGCMSICPSRDLGLSLSGDNAAVADALNNAYDALTQTSAGATTTRLQNKLAYAAANTTVEVEFFHSDDEPPPNVSSSTSPVNLIGVVGTDCYIISGDEDNYVYTHCFHYNEIGWRDPITVRVTHRFALLPGPGRLLSRSRGVSNRGNVYTYTLTASATIGNEGEVPVIQYEY